MATTTPWGPSQHTFKIARGIMQYMTASHGGIHVSPKLNVLIPVYMRQERGWYEEDCAWSIPIVALYGCVDGIKSDLQVQARKTLKNWYWKEYERFYAEVIPPGESYTKDEDMFTDEHKNDYVVTCAYGDRVNGDKMMVRAHLGGNRNTLGKYFMINLEEYKENHAPHGFVIDLARHPEINPD